MSINIDEMQLPKENERRSKSNNLQSHLKAEIIDTIMKFQSKSNYTFESYEVDNVLLSIVQRHHESYLDQKFGLLKP